MAIFYLLHNIIPIGSKESGVTDGQRNCKLFLLGVFIYVMIYIYMKNVQLAGAIHKEWYESLKVGFYVLIIADISVMSFIYKDYYGRSILHEVDETINHKLKEDLDHEYDESKHKYKRKLVDNIFLTKETKKVDVPCESKLKYTEPEDSEHDLNKIIAKSIQDDPIDLDDKIEFENDVELMDNDNDNDNNILKECTEKETSS